MHMHIRVLNMHACVILRMLYSAGLSCVCIDTWQAMIIHILKHMYVQYIVLYDYMHTHTVDIPSLWHVDSTPWGVRHLILVQIVQ